MVAGHAVASLTFISDLLLSPNNELASAKKANEDLIVQNKKLVAEVSQLKTAAEVAEKARAGLAVEVSAGKHANLKLE